MSASPEGLCAFVDASPTPYHCVETVSETLVKGGFTELIEADEWPKLTAGAGYFVKRNGTIIAWRTGHDAPSRVGFRIVGAHTDSPNLRLKPNAEYQKSGLTQWGVQVYGGALLYTWFDRDLGLSGRIFERTDDGLKAHRLRIDRPIARIPSLAIHFNRTVNDQGFKPNPQQHLPPMVALDWGADSTALSSLITDATGIDPDVIVGGDLMLHTLEPSVLGGIAGEFVFAPRIDNQASCYTALAGLMDADDAPQTAMVTLFDHEECGSRSAHGGDGALIDHVLRRLIARHPVQCADGFERAAAKSFMVSADMAHGLHPNYSEYHDGEHKPLLGGGPVIKAHVNQQYATDGETAAVFRNACAELAIPVQEFVIRTDLRCGSTIGPITSANLGIRTVDVGGAMLSMHSAREQAASVDVVHMAAVKAHLLSGR